MWAQNIKVSGKITDDTGESLPGVSIGVKGTTLGTITDIEGNFLLEAKTGSVLVVSFVGYRNKEIIVSGESTNLSIVLYTRYNWFG